MSHEEPCRLQAFVMFPIAHWNDMMEIVAEKFELQSVEERFPDPENLLFPLFAADEGETEPTHRMCCFPTTIPMYQHYRSDLPEWVTIECCRIEYCVSPREFLATQGMTLLSDISLIGLFD